MNSNRSTLLGVMIFGLFVSLPSLANDSPGYLQLRNRIEKSISDESYIPSPRLLWADTCDANSADCLQPDTAFDRYKKDTASEAATKTEPKNWADPYDSQEFGQSPAVSGSTSGTENYKWWYEK